MKGHLKFRNLSSLAAALLVYSADDLISLVHVCDLPGFIFCPSTLRLAPKHCLSPGMCQLWRSHSQTPSWFLVSCNTLMGWWQTNYRPFLVHSLPRPWGLSRIHVPNPNLQGKYIPEPLHAYTWSTPVRVVAPLEMTTLTGVCLEGDTQLAGCTQMCHITLSRKISGFWGGFGTIHRPF
jgi:hypothetical protein